MVPTFPRERYSVCQAIVDNETTHSRRSAALRASLPNSLPMSSPGKGGAEQMACRVASAAAIPVKGSPIPPVEVGLPERELILAQGGWHGLDGGDMTDRSNSNGCLGKLLMGDASTL